MKQIKYDPDTYLLYGVSNPPYPCYPVRLRVTMRDDVKGEVLNGAMQRAIKRYPYFAVQVAVNAERLRVGASAGMGEQSSGIGGYVFQPNSRSIPMWHRRRQRRCRWVLRP